MNKKLINLIKIASKRISSGISIPIAEEMIDKIKPFLALSLALNDFLPNIEKIIPHNP